MSSSSQKQLKLLQFLETDGPMKNFLTDRDYLYLASALETAPMWGDSRRLIGMDGGSWLLLTPYVVMIQLIPASNNSLKILSA